MYFLDDIDYKAFCKSKDFYKVGTLLLEDLEMFHKQMKINLSQSDYQLLQKKYDKKGNSQISYELMISDMEAPYKCFHLYIYFY